MRKRRLFPRKKSEGTGVWVLSQDANCEGERSRNKALLIISMGVRGKEYRDGKIPKKKKWGGPTTHKSKKEVRKEKRNQPNHREPSHVTAWGGKV